VGAEFVLHPLICTLLDFNLAQNTVGTQINAVEKENPHRHGARKPMGDPTIERVNPMFTPVNLWCKPDAKQEKKPPLTSPV